MNTKIPGPKGSVATGLSVKKLLELVPQELIDGLAKELEVDKWVRKLKADYFFKLVLYSILNNERLSLRIMEDNFEDPLFRTLAPALQADEVTWVGIRERLVHIKSQFFQKLYESVYERARKLYGGKRLGKYQIRKYDSTMIATFSHLLEGMKVGNTKKGKTQIKLTTEFSDDFAIRMYFYKDQAHLSEETALKEVIQDVPKEEQDIRVFDKGLKSRKTFEAFEQDNILFVTRLSEKPRYELIKPNSLFNRGETPEDLEFIQDSTVKLYASGHNQLTESEFRLVQYFVKSKQKMLFFLTNVWEVEAATIAHIYKQRWDIEVLFRFMKQEMNLTHFVSNNSNAIEVMLYCTMIASMLVLIYKKQNAIKSYKKAKIQFFKELCYLILYEALDHPEELKRLKLSLKKFIQLE